MALLGPAGEGRADIVKEFLNWNRFVVQDAVADLNLALGCAAERGKVSVVEVILSCRELPTAVLDSALRSAILYGQADVVRTFTSSPRFYDIATFKSNGRPFFDTDRMSANGGLNLLREVDQKKKEASLLHKIKVVAQKTSKALFERL